MYKVPYLTGCVFMMVSASMIWPLKVSDALGEGSMMGGNLLDAL